ncbi:MAG: NAD(+) synthase [Candidatus Levybacteria bacterium]|nr:NAD(+) synthase [Candidatus Levybacteria bacterium]
MDKNLLDINPKKEKNKITDFLKSTLNKQKIKNVIIGLSGGIDSMTSFYLLKDVLPPENIFIAHLYYFEKSFDDLDKVIKAAGLPSENIHYLSIKKPVDAICELLRIGDNKIRIGNVIARIRMIILYDLAKKYNALVCGTENKSEHYLGYFTRFGDEASDMEPTRHLYKTQLYQLASYLDIPKEFIAKHPTAGLWEGQTDEKEFGFSYRDADPILYLYFDKKMTLENIKNMGFANAEKIINFANKNAYKHNTPYVLK